MHTRYDLDVELGTPVGSQLATIYRELLTDAGWTEELYAIGNPYDSHRLIFSSPGYSGSDAFYVGFAIERYVSTNKFDVVMACMASVDDTESFYNQAGFVQVLVVDETRLDTANTGLIAVTPQAVIFTNERSVAYAGKLFQYAQPQPWPTGGFLYTNNDALDPQFFLSGWQNALLQPQLITYAGESTPVKILADSNQVIDALQVYTDSGLLGVLDSLVLVQGGDVHNADTVTVGDAVFDVLRNSTDNTWNDIDSVFAVRVS